MSEEAPTRIPLRLVADAAHHVDLDDLGGGAWEVRTTGGDPYVFTAPLADSYDAAKTHVLAFEFFSATGTNGLQVFFGPPIDEPHSVKAPGLAVSEAWSECAVDLSTDTRHWTKPCGLFRLDFGTQPGKTIRVRNLVLREPTARERDLAATREAKRLAELEQTRQLEAYLRADFPCCVTRVAVTRDSVQVSVETAGQQGSLVLGEIPMYAAVTDASPFRAIIPLRDVEGEFSAELVRYAEEGGRKADRLFSRWAVARRTAGGFELLSHAHYPDEVEAAHDLPEERPRGRKGLGGFHVGRAPVSDLDDLGISSVTVNVTLSDILRAQAGDDTMAFEFDGRTCHASKGALERYDRTLTECARRGIIVSAIVLIRHGKHIPDPALRDVFTHPDCHPSAQFTMANLTSREGFELYAAALDLLARRYSRPDKRHGRIHHWILHNEVDAGWVWTNCGEKTPVLYMDLYHRSMRTAHLIARKYDPHAQAFISLTHYWNWTSSPRFYLPRELLDLLLAFSGAEGDFQWGIAQHPYPESLFEPKTWLDGKCTLGFDTPLITYRNIEVLDAWVRQERALFRGTTQRKLHLTEQGFHSRDYGESALREQAAGMAYAWQKIKALDSIETNHYHNWVDNRHEGGLRIGLRRFPDDADEPLGPKPIWHVYAKLETDGEEAACEFAKTLVGIRDWPEVRHAGPIAGGGEP